MRFRFWIVLSVCVFAAACSSHSEAEPLKTAEKPAAEKPSTPSSSSPGDAVAAPSSAPLSIASAAAGSPPAESEIAGEIFGVPVTRDNYYFAKLVANIFSRPWGAADLPESEREASVWENLILHYTAFERGIQASDKEVDDAVNQLLKDEKQEFTRSSDPPAYKDWVKKTLNEDTELLENQMRYLIMIRKLKDQVREEQEVVVNEEEMRQEFLNEQNHVGGEAVMFDSKDKAQAFYEKYKDPKAWDKMKASGDYNVRPVSLMTLEAYIDLWSIPKDQMYAFHSLEIGTVGPPMPFGPKEWSVYRLLEKRTGNLDEFPPQRDQYYRQMQVKKKYDALQQWVERRKADARPKILIKP